MRSGVMIRSGTDAQAPYYGVFLTPSNGVAVQWRASQAAQTQQVAEAGLVAPQYVEAARYTDPASGNVFYAAYSSTDGVTWTYVPNSQVALNLPGPLVAGLASDANSSLNLTVATFDNVVQQATEQAPPFLCPSGWSCNDIGGALPPGQDSLVNGSWTETAGGGDIWGTADAFHLVTEPLAADGTVTAHVTSQQNTNAWAKAGVMVRATSDPGSPYYGVFVTPGNGVVVQWRAAQGGASTQVLATGTAPVYLRVGRFTTSGSSPQTYYTAYTSPDGTTWTAVPGSTVVLAMPGTLQAGLALTSHAQGVGGTVTFDSVAVAPGEVPPPGFACPSGWTCGDIGAASPAGSQSLSGGTWTILGGGADIFGTADAFHFAWQGLAGDGSLSTRVVSHELAERLGQGRAHAAGHHRPGLGLLRRLRHPRQRCGRAVARRDRRVDRPGDRGRGGPGVPPGDPDRHHLHRGHLARRDHLDDGAGRHQDPGRSDRPAAPRAGRDLPQQRQGRHRGLRLGGREPVTAALRSLPAGRRG